MKGNNKMILEGLNNYYKCKQCAKQFLCKECTGLVKFSQTKGYGIPERKEKWKNIKYKQKQ